MQDSRIQRQIQMEQEQEQLLVNKLDLEIMKDREKAINEICDDVQMINESFEHLRDHVQAQGVILDNIEAHLEKAEVTVEKGTEEIVKANSYAKSAKNMMLGLFSIVGTIALGVGLALGLK